MASMSALEVILGAFAIVLLCSSQIEAKDCSPGLQTCNGEQVVCKANVNSDVRNCGKCGWECPSAPHSQRTCQKGHCGYTCEGPFRDCDHSWSNGCETNVEYNPLHCGECGKRCPVPNANSIATCSEYGRCSFKCKAGSLLCNKACIDVEKDVKHCGRCGVECPAVANANSTCSDGHCRFACINHFADCDGVRSNGCEVDTSTDVSHCGSCGVACPDVGNAAAKCSAGHCSFTCFAGFADCDGIASNGCEVDTSTDLSNCGSCGVICPNVTNAARFCYGQCGFSSCNPGFTFCNGDSSNGCDVDLSTSVSNCGACNAVCVVPPNSHATPTCSAGQCGFTCDAGFADCDGISSNGCEVDTSTDVSHCGRCGVACPDVANATATCSGGQCGFTCDAGFADCDGIASNGCEVDTFSDLSDCGSCGVACPDFANAATICSAGHCIFTCEPGFADCDGISSNGCEVDTSSDLSDCGSCGVICPNVANAPRRCFLGECGFSTCNPGFTFCNGDSSNGCDVDLSTSVSNCGACNAVCVAPPHRHATPTCSAGQCGVICDAGFAHCDPLGLGCETDLSTVQNCGSCGLACPSGANSTATCTGGQCHLTCDPGFADCDGDPSNGCEVDITTASNCGQCRHACPAAFSNAHATCSSGQCGVVCDNGFADCNGSPSDGCETNINTDNNNCRYCGCSCSAIQNDPAQINIASTDCSGGQCNVHCTSAACSCDNSGNCNCNGGLLNIDCHELPFIARVCFPP